MEARAAKAQEQAAQLYTRAKEMASAIPFGQPILIGHHSEGRDRNYRAKIESTFRRSFEVQDKAKHYAERLESIGEGGIASDDPQALDKLRQKLEGLQRSHESMKAANLAIRKHKGQQAAQVEALQALGYTQQRALELLRGDHCGRIGFPAYVLSLSNAEQKRIEQRIAQLERMATRADVKEERKGYSYEESKEEGRIFFRFPGIPNEAVRNVLKRHGFKWSRYSSAWVRKMTPNALASVRYFTPALEAAISAE
jgi:uncharacterized coiled-coil DUF342 family protein